MTFNTLKLFIIGLPCVLLLSGYSDKGVNEPQTDSRQLLYGKQIASAEAYTDAKFNHSLSDLKSLADYAYAFGINEFVICASSYQPWTDRIPGSTGGGRHYCINRNNTWWKYSNDFWDYQSRLAYAMRQGKPKADLCIYLGENAPVKILTYRLPDLPGGFDFDAFTSDALINRMDANDSNIVLPDGVCYQMMILPRNGELTMRALEQIADLVGKGARVYGPRAVYSGRRYRLPVQTAEKGRMSIDLQLQPMESYLIVLSDKEVDESLPYAPWTDSEKKTELTGGWNVSFDTRMGGPAGTVAFDSLSDWTSYDDKRIRYYSGTASYRKVFDIDRIKPDERFFIQLDSPVFIADILVNGRKGGTVWCSPWRCDVTDMIKKGKNQLEIKVANSLMNRMIGDAGLPQEERVTYCYPEIVTEKEPLMPSGLTGKIYIVRSEQTNK